MLPLPQVVAVPLSISFVKVHVKYSLHYYYYYYYLNNKRDIRKYVESCKLWLWVMWNCGKRHLMWHATPHKQSLSQILTLSAQFYFSLFSLNRALEFKKEGSLVFHGSNVANWKWFQLTSIKDFSFYQTFTFLPKNVGKVISKIDIIYYIPISFYIPNYSKYFFLWINVATVRRFL
jgi:hypothetical protein